ncbi:hypothetical protein Dsin_013115 [Dipteronia sinensis]|uniref:Uncharacterized protein n=1 Tax=Dipteronia sinensis TaxID=43782 RepID=A0AAE0EA96_9ROSI|nr:hypothetical protein Dsin_013115 [Dipteronia sinensis]
MDENISGEKERQGRERKGWMIMVYDFSGSPGSLHLLPHLKIKPGCMVDPPSQRCLCEGKVSKPVVQVGAQHVTCMADAALFVALSAAIDLCMDTCT